MAKTMNLNFRVDSDLKEEAEALYKELGLSMSAALTIFLKQSVRYGGIPFELRLNIPNEKTLAAIRDAENNSDLSRAFNSVEDLFEDLDA